jgi:peroxiredoxin
VYLTVTLVFALMQMFGGAAPVISSLGLTLAAAAPMGFIFWLYLSGRARTSRHPVAVTALCGLGTAITMTANWRFEASSGNLHIWAGLCLLAWFGYVRWYSVLGHRGSKALIPGTELPEFELQTLRGEPINSGSFRGRNHVLVFYRGNWCPLCSAQISELAAQYRKLQAADTEVVLISSQPQNHSLHLAKKFDAPMIFLRDKNNAAAGILGIKHRFGTPMGMQILGYDNDTALPTVIITNKQGTILHVDETDNYRLRPDPALFLDILMKHEAV